MSGQVLEGPTEQGKRERVRGPILHRVMERPLSIWDELSREQIWRSPQALGKCVLGLFRKNRKEANVAGAREEERGWKLGQGGGRTRPAPDALQHLEKWSIQESEFYATQRSGNQL